MTGTLRYCGRDFSASEMEVVRALAASLPTRRAIADAICDELGWRRVDGRRKDMSARVALLRMADDGLVTLPAPRNANNRNGRIPRHEEAPAELPLAMSAPLRDLGQLQLVVVATAAEKRRWRSLVATHHYLGYVPLPVRRCATWSRPEPGLSARSGSPPRRGSAHPVTPISAGTPPRARPGCTSWWETPAS